MRAEKGGRIRRALDVLVAWIDYVYEHVHEHGDYPAAGGISVACSLPPRRNMSILRARIPGGKAMSRDVLAEIRDEIAANKVLLYMKGNPSFPMCGFSAATVEVLRATGQPFAHVNILEDPEKREAIKAYSNWPTIPQLYINGEFVGGCDIVQDLYASGELQRLLATAFAGEAAAAKS
jgi:monothiol glutaredoxin